LRQPKYGEHGVFHALGHDCQSVSLVPTAVDIDIAQHVARSRADRASRFWSKVADSKTTSIRREQPDASNLRARISVSDRWFGTW
jgi:hypothetical protein